MAYLDRKIVRLSIALGAIRRDFDGFGKLAILADQAAGNTLGGSRVATFTSATAADDAVTAGTLASATRDAIRVAFSQPDTDPAAVKVIRVDTAATETWGAALAAGAAADPDFYGVASMSRAAADQASIVTAIETMERIYVAQDGTAGWKTTGGGFPSGYSAFATRERGAVLYHDTDTEYGDVAWIAARLGFNPDRQSAGWKGPIAAVDPYATTPTDTELEAIQANLANVATGYGSEPMFVYPGKNTKGRPIDHVLSRDWFAIRLREDVAARVITLARQGRKLTADAEGQSILLGICEARAAKGVEAGHFRRGQVRFARGPVNAGTGEIQITGAASLTVDGLIFDFALTFTTDDVNTTI